MKSIFLLLTICFASITITAQSEQKQQTKTAFIEIAFLSNGDIIADGKKTTVKKLELKLKELKKKKGEVHYYQAPRIKQVHLMRNMNLVQTIRGYKLRMIAYADKEFSKVKGF